MGPKCGMGHYRSRHTAMDPLEQCTGAEDLLEQVGLSKLAAMTLQRKSTLPTSVAKSTYLQQLNVSLRSGPAMELTPLLSADPIPAHQLRHVARPTAVASAKTLRVRVWPGGRGSKLGPQDPNFEAQVFEHYTLRPSGLSCAAATSSVWFFIHLRKPHLRSSAGSHASATAVSGSRH